MRYPWKHVAKIRRNLPVRPRNPTSQIKAQFELPVFQALKREKIALRSTLLVLLSLEPIPGKRKVCPKMQPQRKPEKVRSETTL
jgi:hypothetical protein